MEYLNKDKRWEYFNEIGFVCSSCKERHRGLFDLSCDRPDYWEGPEEPSSNSHIRDSNHILTSDFCIIENRDYFIRCVLLLPLAGREGQFFGFGVWSSLSKKNFDLYVSTFDEYERQSLGPWFGWFSNHLKGYPQTLNLKCQVLPQNHRQRPLIQLEETDHPLAIEQMEGITFDRVLELYALYGHALETNFPKI